MATVAVRAGAPGRSNVTISDQSGMAARLGIQTICSLYAALAIKRKVYPKSTSQTPDATGG